MQGKRENQIWKKGLFLQTGILFKNQIQIYQNTKKKPVLEILSGLLSQLSDGGIASR